jgi:serine phosphatase RsbU (regulator of sigma subunit)
MSADPIASGHEPARGEALPSADGAADPRVTLWNSAADAIPAGGDWCAAFPISDYVTAVTIGDVSGHGEAVAETMSVLRRSVLRAMQETRVPSDVLAIANDAAYRHAGGVIVTAIVAFFDRRHGTLAFANAGHPPPLLTTARGGAFLQQLPADLPLGVYPAYSAADYVVAVPADALLVFYTDGITEHRRDPICGEAELVVAARVVHARPEINAARAIARRVFLTSRGDDDAAAIALRTLPSRRDGLRTLSAT